MMRSQEYADHFNSHKRTRKCSVYGCLLLPQGMTNLIKYTLLIQTSLVELSDHYDVDLTNGVTISIYCDNNDRF